MSSVWYNINKGVILNVDSTSKMSHPDYHLLKQKTWKNISEWMESKRKEDSRSSKSLRKRSMWNWKWVVQNEEISELENQKMMTWLYVCSCVFVEKLWTNFRSNHWENICFPMHIINLSTQLEVLIIYGSVCVHLLYLFKTTGILYTVHYFTV